VGEGRPYSRESRGDHDGADVGVGEDGEGRKWWEEGREAVSSKFEGEEGGGEVLSSNVDRGRREKVRTVWFENETVRAASTSHPRSCSGKVAALFPESREGKGGSDEEDEDKESSGRTYEARHHMRLHTEYASLLREVG
jgi:hypothetical protein